MKKILAILMTVMLLCVSSAALAVTVTIEDNDKAEVTITAADIDTGAAITKSDYAKDKSGSLQFSNKDNRDAYYASNGYTPWYSQEATPKKTVNSAKNKAENTTKSTKAGSSNRRMSGQTMPK